MGERGRTRSFSENLVLDDAEKGGVVIADIKDASFAQRSGLKEGDEIVGATIHFGHLKKDEVEELLKLIEPFDNQMQVLKKEDLQTSLSLGSLNPNSKVPEDMLKDSYNKRYKDKVRKYLKPEASLSSTDEDLSVDLNGSGKLHAPRAGLNLEGTTLNGESPRLNAKIPDVDLNPSLKSSGVKLTTPDLQIPKVSLQDSDPDVSLPSVSGPRFTMPSVGMSGPKLKGAELDGTFRGPDLNIPEPKLNGPDVNLESQLPKGKLDLSGPKGNITEPKLDIKTPSTSLNLEKPKVGSNDVKYTPPKFQMPNFNLPEIKPKTPDVNMSAPNLKADGQAPSIDVKGLKTDLKAPDLDLNLAKSDLKGPDLDVKTPDVDVDGRSGKIKWPTFKLPKFGSSEPKVKGPDVDIDADVKTPNLNLSAPKLEADLDAPGIDVNSPKADLKGPNLDLKGPDAEIDGSSGKFRWPSFKKKLGLSGPKVKSDIDFDGDVQTPDLNLSAPKLEADLNAPDARLSLPQADLKTPDADIDAPPGKFKWLTGKKPRFGSPKVTAPDVDVPDGNLSGPEIKGNLEGPDLDVNLPKADLSGSHVEMKAPKADIDSPTGKFKFSHFKLPKFNLTGPRVKKTEMNADLETPNMRLSGPKIEGDIKAPDVNRSLPEADLKGPDVDLKLPSVGLDTDLKAPNLSLEKPKIEGDLNAPQIDSPSAKVKKPLFKLPKFDFSGPKVKGPDVDANLEAPGMNLSGPKIKGDLNPPDVNLDLPKGDLEGPDLDLKSPNIGLDSDLKTPNLSLEKPKIEGDLNAPQIDSPSAKVKKPHFRLPKFDFSGPKVKGPDVDAGLEAPDMNLSAPEIKADLNTPDVDLGLPNADLKGPELDLKAPDVDADAPGKFKWLTLKGPKFGQKVKTPDADIKADFKSPDLSHSAPDIDGDLKLSNLDVNAPKASLSGPDLDLKAPDVAIDGQSGKPKVPAFKKPRFGISGPKLKGGNLDVDADVKTPDLDYSGPKLDGGLNAPNPDLNLPKSEVDGVKMDIESPDAKGKFKWPFKWGFGSKDSDGDAEAAIPDVDGAYEITEPDIKLPKGTGEVPAFKLHKLPDFNYTPPEVPYGSLFHSMAKTDLKAPGISTDITGGQLEIPQLESSLKSPSLQVESPDTEATNPRVSFPKVNALPVDGFVPDILGLKGEAPKSIDIKERLKQFKDSVSRSATAPDISTNLPGGESDLGLTGELGAPSVEVSSSPDGDGTSMRKQGTFKVNKPDPDKDYPSVNTEISLPTLDV